MTFTSWLPLFLSHPSKLFLSFSLSSSSSYYFCTDQFFSIYNAVLVFSALCITIPFFITPLIFSPARSLLFILLFFFVPLFFFKFFSISFLLSPLSYTVSFFLPILVSISFFIPIFHLFLLLLSFSIFISLFLFFLCS